jgi:hypothetical protein
MFDTGDTWMMARSPVPVLVSDFKPENDLRCAHRHSSVLANRAGMLNLN